MITDLKAQISTDKKIHRWAQISTSLRASLPRLGGASERSNPFPEIASTVPLLRSGRLAMTLMLIVILLLCEDAHCFNVSPSRIEISASPSKEYNSNIIVRNEENKKFIIKLRTEDWFTAVEGIKKEKSSTFKWLEINPLEFEINEQETKEVSYKVSVPKDAKGELNAMIFVEGRPKETKEGAITINTSIGIPIYVMIKGTEQFKAEVENLQVIRSSPLKLEIKIKNSGNVHIRPTGTIVIARMTPSGARGPTKQSLKIVLPLNEYNYPILPNSSRTLEIKSNHRLEQGEYVADIKMGFADKKYKTKIMLKVE